jgi:S-DNA-T family DNA segregation ATPase FtsK/SpoIIIE
LPAATKVAGRLFPWKHLNYRGISADNEAEGYALRLTECFTRFLRLDAHRRGSAEKVPFLKNLQFKLSNDTHFRFRAIAIVAAVFLWICALLLGLSLLNALFGIPVFPAGPANLFARSYGILAFFIPVYLGYAAFILAETHWRPDRIFLLSAGIFPFFTLVIGFTFIRDFESRASQFAFVDFAGKTGFGFVIVLITILEVLSLRLIKNTLFPPDPNAEDRRGRRDRARRHGRIGLLPPPKSKLTEVYAEAAASIVGRDRNEQTATDRREGDVPAERVCEHDRVDAGFTGEARRGEVSRGDPVKAKTAVDSGPDNVRLPSFPALNGPPVFQKPGKETVVETEPDEEVFEEFSGEEDSSEAEDKDSVEWAIEEAEANAAAHARHLHQKAAAFSHIPKRKYNVPVEILNEYPDGEYWIIDQATREAALILKATLEEFKIQAEVTGIRKGPVITMFEILPAPGVKLSRIVNLQDNIALRLAASSVRIVAPIPGKHAVGIEVPNAKRNIVSFREIIEGELQRTGKKPEIPVVMGKDITGEAQTIDLVQMPHLLIAGATGSGKSVCVNSMILSILYQLHPSDCRLILIDPKIVELKLYNDIPHLLTPVITEPKRAFQALQYCIYEMERRYACLDSMGVRDIRNYNKRIREKNIAQEHIPYIVVVIDEFADLMATTGKELESTVARLAAMSRAVGIHLVLATQRPSIDVITGLIKANIPSRIAFMVASKMDSRIIIDMVGAEKLLGKGDMLYAGAVDPFPIRMQGAFISEEEVEAVVAHVKTFGAPDYIDDEIFYDEDEDDTSPALFSEGDDPLYDKALEIVLQQGKASASYIQRRLKIGYNRSARLVEEMERKGVVGPAQGSKPRELLRGV